MDVALFITCLTDTLEPRVGVAMVRLLRHFGCRVRFPSAQTCCGQPQYNNGYHAEAAALGRRMIDIFAGYEHIVTPSGSCAAMVKHHLPELLKDDAKYHSRAADLARRTCEFGRFMTEVLKVSPADLAAPSGTPLTFHYSCHLRGIADADDAERLVRDMRGVGFRPLRLRDECCGFGGAFHVEYSPIADAMCRDKIENIRATGASTVVCNEAGCGMNIGGCARRLGANVRIAHFAEIWAESLGLMDDAP
jgi:L-lactate dehydrogenase complex protein LldE